MCLKAKGRGGEGRHTCNVGNSNENGNLVSDEKCGIGVKQNKLCCIRNSGSN